jgi:heme oxygenase
MNLKNMLGRIKANGRDRRQVRDNLCHGRRSFSELLNGNHLGTALIEPDAGPGAVRIINLADELGVRLFPSWSDGATVHWRAGVRAVSNSLFQLEDSSAAAATREAAKVL